MSPLHLAWRNLARNRGRTAITGAAVALSTTLLVVTFALTEGMLNQLVDSITKHLVGHVQLHAPGYRAERSLYAAIAAPGALVAAAEAEGLRAAPRTYGFGLLSHGTKSAGATFIGVDPAREKATFELWRQLAAGDFFTAERRGQVILGSRLARSLNVGVGDELVAIVQAADGSLGNELYRVGAVLRSVGESLDRGAALLLAADFDQLFLTGDVAHEIALTAPDRPLDEVTTLAAALAPDAEAKSWRQLMPAISDMLEMSRALMFLFGAIFFLAAAIGVLNTMLMATHDRVRELGVIKAIGATPLRIIVEVTTEGLLLALIATLLGGALGAALSLWLESHPLDLAAFSGSGFSFSGLVWDTLWYAKLLPSHVVAAVAPMWVASVAAALYPAVKAARLDPVKAMTHV